MLTADYTNILLDLKEAIVTKVIAENKTLTIFIEQPKISHSCPTCSARTEKVHDYRCQNIKDIAVQGKNVVLRLRKRRYVCPACNKRFLERNPLLARYQRMTKRLLSYLLSLFAQTCSISRWLLLKRLYKLTDDEKIQLANLLSISEPLRKAYLLKEEFYNMLNSTTHADMIMRWRHWQDRVVQAGLPDFDRFMQTTAKWSKAIMNAAKTGYSNGFTEGCNNRIKVLKRVSYGVKNFERFRNRILYIANS